MADGSLTKHGFPRGYRFVPTPLELITLLTEKIDGHGLSPPLDRIFRDVPILNYHPEELYERYKEYAEHRYIYFFSKRELQKPAGGAAIPEEKGQKERRPVRVARGGGWKPSGGGHVLYWPRKRGGFVAGRMVTMVFYDREEGKGSAGVKSNWGMHEFLVPVDKSLISLDDKYTRFHGLALYRLYILKGGELETNNGAGSSSQMMANAYDDRFSASKAVAPCPPLQPWGIFTAGASTSQMPPPRLLPSAEHAQYYHLQHAFGSAAAGAAAQQQAHDMPVLGFGLPANLCQFAIPPAPVPVPVPPAAANPAAHQAPATATHGAGQEAGHSGATRSRCSPPAPGIPPAEQHTTATAEPAHAQFADCIKPMEEATPVPPPLEDIVPAAEDERMTYADGYYGPGMPDWNLDFTPLDDSIFSFTMEEILAGSAFDEPPAMEGDTNISGGENYSQAEAGDTQQDPPVALN